MPSFAYSAINAQGDELTGEIQATDLSAARDALRGDGLLAAVDRGDQEQRRPTKKKSGASSHEEGASRSRCRSSRASSRR